MMPDDNPHFRDVLSEKAARYRRNVLVISAILLALHLFPDVDFSGLSFFGIKPDSETIEPRTYVIVCALLLLTYNGGLFGYFAWENWRDWCVAALGLIGRSDGFPDWKMYLGARHPPTAEITRVRLKGANPEQVTWKYVENEKSVRWVEIKKNQAVRAYELDRNSVRSARRRIRMFLWFDCFFVAVFVAVTLIIVGVEYFELLIFRS